MPGLRPQDVAEELARRQGQLSVIDRLLAPLSGPMRNFVTSPAKERAAQCTRRAGKSSCAALAGIIACLREPHMTVAILGKTMKTVENTFWRPILKKFERTYHIGMKFSSDMEVEFPNGSVIQLAAADANEDQKLKIFGVPYKLVIIDEAEAFVTDLRELVEDVLGPSMIDYDGSIVLCGMPCNRTYGFFYDVVTRARGKDGVVKHPSWELHRWSALDNPFISRQFKETMERKILEKPSIVDDPGFRQMWLNEWVIDTEKKVYRATPANILIPGQFASIMTDGNHFRGVWHHALGVDIGFEDDTALVLVAWHTYDPRLYIQECFKRPGMDITATALKIKEFKSRHQIENITIDGSNKQAVMEMVRRHNLQLQPADKRGKADFIDIMNAELSDGKIMVDPSCTELLDEWSRLVWDEKLLKQGTRQEDGKCPNHLSDACLYAWRMTRTYWARDLPKDPIGRNPQLSHLRDMMERHKDDVGPSFAEEPDGGWDEFDPWQSDTM